MYFESNIFESAKNNREYASTNQETQKNNREYVSTL